MTETRGLRLSTSAAHKEGRLLRLLQGRDPTDVRLLEAVEDAQVRGSLELAGIACTQEEIAAARGGRPAPAAVIGMCRALRAVEREAPLSVSALLAWHGAVTGGGRFRAGERSREEGPPPAPAAFIASRLAIVEEWLNADSGRELRPAQQGALVLARVLEILPFDSGNGRVSRLAASHVMARAGSRPPVLTGGDGPRLAQALQAAFQLETRPLSALLEEASERALDLMIARLEAEGGG